ncbi:hypothetical protein R6Q57_027046 [Mikania cordata]
MARPNSIWKGENSLDREEFYAISQRKYEHKWKSKQTLKYLRGNSSGYCFESRTTGQPGVVRYYYQFTLCWMVLIFIRVGQCYKKGVTFSMILRNAIHYSGFSSRGSLLPMSSEKSNLGLYIGLGPSRPF